MKTLVVGVGNPILGDDGVGPVVAGSLCRVAGEGSWDCLPFTGSGLDLLAYIGAHRAYDRVVVVDCLDTGALEEGAVARVVPPQASSLHYNSSHHIGVLEAFALATRLSVPIPEDVRVYAIGVRGDFELSESLSRELEACVPAIVGAIHADLESPAQGDRP